MKETNFQARIEYIVTNGVGYYEKYDMFDRIREKCYEYEKLNNLISLEGSLFESSLLKLKLAQMELYSVSNVSQRIEAFKYRQKFIKEILSFKESFEMSKTVKKIIDDAEKAGLKIPKGHGMHFIIPDGECSVKF
jgi:hypothetical protein